MQVCKQGQKMGFIKCRKNGIRRLRYAVSGQLESDGMMEITAAQTNHI